MRQLQRQLTATDRAHDAGADVDPTALELARRRLGWSYRRLGAKVGASHVAAFRWCQGLRPAPASLYAALGVPAPAQHPQPAAEERPRPRVTVRLPSGVSEEEAFAACARAVAQALNQGREEDIP